MKKKILIASLVTIFLGLIIGGCHMKEKETLTKLQQDNVVKRIVRVYDIHSIEFTKFSKDQKTGSYHLLFVINGDRKYKTGLTVSEIDRFNNSTNDISLSPSDIFNKFKRDLSSHHSQREFEKVKITYLEQ